MPIRPLTQAKKETTLAKEREGVKHHFVKKSSHTCEELGPHYCHITSTTISKERARLDKVSGPLPK